MMATLIAYLRQYTTGGVQADSLGEQRQAITTWARNRRHRIAAFVEEALGPGLGERPGLAEAMVHLGDDGVDGFVVAQLASLDDDLVTQEQLIAEVGRAGGKIYSLSAGDAELLRATPADPTRHMVRRVLTAAAANEASIAALRSASRMANGGSPAYGYRRADGQLIPDADEQATLARITELHGAGATLREIARTLENEGHRPKRAARWHPEALRRIVRRTQA
jgi:DNA invertase Pin-like site-specific DNA recombinase